MKKIQRIGFMILAIFLGFSHFSVPAKAEGWDFSFLVKVHPNDYQTTDVRSYYKWKVHGGEKVEGWFDLENLTDHPVTIRIQPTNALTSPSGGVDYTSKTEYESKQGKHLDPNYQMIFYVSVPNEVQLQPKETKRISFFVDVPRLSGDLLGGLRFEEIQQETTTKDVTVRQQYHQVIAIHLDYKKKETPQLEVEKVERVKTQTGEELHLSIRNDSPTIVSNFTGRVVLTHKETKKETRLPMSSFTVAPFTTFTHVLPLPSLEKGDYDVHIEYGNPLSMKETKSTFTLEKDIVSTDQPSSSSGTVKEETRPDSDESHHSFLPYVITWGGVVFMIIMLFVYRQKYVK